MPGSRPVPVPRPEPVATPVIRYHPDRHIRIDRFGYPHTELGRRTFEYTRRREAAEAVPRLHLPRWRLRFALAVGLFPILWVLPKCRECGKPWPCHPILAHLRRRHGWSGSIHHHVKALSTKRRRARAAARNPTAISHRAR